MTAVRKLFLIPAVAVLLLPAACASLKPPRMHVEKIKLEKARVTGLGMEVHFSIQNPNPEPLFIQRFEYELKLNGYRLGRGYYPDALDLRSFTRESVVSHFELNWLSLPGSVRSVLEGDRAKAEVRGTFYRRTGGGLKKLRFRSHAEVRLRE